MQQLISTKQYGRRANEIHRELKQGIYCKIRNFSQLLDVARIAEAMGHHMVSCPSKYEDPDSLEAQNDSPFVWSFLEAISAIGNLLLGIFGYFTCTHEHFITDVVYRL